MNIGFRSHLTGNDIRGLRETPIGEGTADVFPTFTANPLTVEAVQLCPCGIATVTPRFLHRGLRASDIDRP